MKSYNLGRFFQLYLFVQVIQAFYPSLDENDAVCPVDYWSLYAISPHGEFVSALSNLGPLNLLQCPLRKWCEIYFCFDQSSKAQIFPGWSALRKGNHSTYLRPGRLLQSSVLLISELFLERLVVYPTQKCSGIMRLSLLEGIGRLVYLLGLQ